MSLLKDLSPAQKRKMFSRLSKAERDRILDIIARYIYDLEEKDKKLKEIFKI